MLRSSKFALILGLAGASVLPSLAVAQQGAAARKDSDAAGVAAAIRFQKAEDAAAARQARIDAGRGGESNSVAGAAPQTTAKAVQKESQPVGVEAAIRFQRAEDAAAARQARIEGTREDESSSADRMAPEPKSKTKTARTASATARPRNSQ
jgi:hypothetical protein